MVSIQIIWYLTKNVKGEISAGVKWVSGLPETHKRRLPYITGLLILNDTETGLPLAIIGSITFSTSPHLRRSGPVGGRAEAGP